MVSATENFKILVVDDETLCRASIATFGKKLKLNIDQAENGKEAIEKVKTNNYSLILLDIIMPEMNGFEAAKGIRELPNGSSPILIALSGDKLEEEQLKSYNFATSIVKPITKSKFEALIEQYKK